MRTLVRYAFSIGTAALLAGCGGSQITFGVPAGVTQTSAITRARTVVPHIPPRKSFQVLRQFNFTDGGLPYSGLIQVDGTLYGTTFMGGRYGYGTVYNVSTTGEEKVLHSFRGGADGEFPEAGLINVKGSLYGTTSTGGGPSCAGYGCGTVYSVNMSGSETVLHSFAGGADGSFPYAGLINVKGTLYGTTSLGGGSRCTTMSQGCGTVYRITTTGSERVLHSFGTGSDGSFPDAGLRDVNGTLYGTTESGGSSNHGTVYRVSTTGAEKVLHSFAGGSDGAQPIADLINVGGMLYGTTWQGGGSYGSGTVYRISTAGVEKVLYSFAGGLDGALPEAGLINVNGTLYGTTIDGGAFHESAGYGTIYSVTTTGSEKVLHRFAGGSDGSQPAAGLINLKGILYGTTSVGGITQKCLYHSCGIVFALSR